MTSESCVLVNREQQASGHGGALILFVVICLGCQLLIGLSVWPEARAVLRTAPFVASIGMLFAIHGVSPKHPAARWAIVVLLINWTLLLLNPVNGGVIAAIAAVTLSTAVLAPVFWAPRLRIEQRSLSRLLIAWWLFQGASAGLGILQVYWPETFALRISDQLKEVGPGYLDSLSITRPDGVSVIRPMGLTDLPGGAAISALYVLVVGTGLASRPKARSHRAVIYLIMLIAATCLFVCQIRSILVVAVLCSGLIVLLLVIRRQLAMAKTISLALGVVVCLGFTWAVTVGGVGVRERVSTLAESNPARVYYRNRGFFVEQAILEVLPEYPLGAGLGRWGMMNQYFSDEGGASPLHAEVQWTGWAYDGGVLLVAANAALLLSALAFGWRRATQVKDENWIWCVVVFALNCALVALSFDAPVFSSQVGMEFWLFNGLLAALAPIALSAGLAKE